MADRDSVLKHSNLITFDSKMALFNPCMLFDFFWGQMTSFEVLRHCSTLFKNTHLRFMIPEIFVCPCGKKIIIGMLISKHDAYVPNMYIFRLKSLIQTCNSAQEVY